MRYIPFFLLLILMLTSCSQHTVEKEIILEKQIPIEKEVSGIIPEFIIQQAEKKYGKSVRNRYEAFNEKMHELQNSSDEVKLEEINNFFNKVPYVDDIKIWNKSDYWATPLEFLGKDKGDCEDYVIAKYFSLRHLGLESKTLYFSYVKSTQFTRTHMVLSYYETPSSTPLILDNVNIKIFPADKRTDLIPVYHFNGESIYHTSPTGKKTLKSRKFNKKWDKLINNISRNKL